MKQAFHPRRQLFGGIPLLLALGAALALLGCSSPRTKVQAPGPAQSPQDVEARATGEAEGRTKPASAAPQEPVAATVQAVRPTETTTPAKPDTRQQSPDARDSSTRSKPTAKSSPPAPSAPPAAVPAPAPKPVAAPHLDLTELEQRLRDTHAIGVFTKLSLKNQVDDLLTAFRAFHAGHSAIGLPELRQRFDLLLLKVLSLLQDGDLPLAKAVSTSREAIWGVLIDPQQFAKL